MPQLPNKLLGMWKLSMWKISKFATFNVQYHYCYLEIEVQVTIIEINLEIPPTNKLLPSDSLVITSKYF